MHRDILHKYVFLRQFVQMYSFLRGFARTYTFFERFARTYTFLRVFCWNVCVCLYLPSVIDVTIYELIITGGLASQ